MSHKSQACLPSHSRPWEQLKKLSNSISESVIPPLSSQQGPSPMSPGGLWVWLLWKGTCQIKSVNGNAIKQGEGKFSIFAFFPRTWHISVLSRSFLAAWTSILPNSWYLEGMLGTQIAISVSTTVSNFLKLSRTPTSVCTLGFKALMGIMPCIDHVAPAFPEQFLEIQLNTARCFLLPGAQ